jgi:hypothetical protein
MSSAQMFNSPTSHPKQQHYRSALTTTHSTLPSLTLFPLFDLWSATIGKGASYALALFLS